MPIQSTNRNTTWAVNMNDLTWTLTKTATITVNNQWGIYESASGNDIVVLGDIVAKGATYGGIRFQGSDSEVRVGVDSVINALQADFGIFAEGAGSNITNRGVIKSGSEGIHGEIWGDVKNYGTVTADYGIRYLDNGSQIYNYGKVHGSQDAIDTGADGTYILNDKDASITGGVNCIMLTNNGDATIVNRGLISATSVAIDSLDGVLKVVNSGKIVGDVYLGDGNDRFDTRGGTLQGMVYGGLDNDTYLISSGNVKIIEIVGGGTADKVFSSASYTLAGQVENLKLIGGADLDAIGNKRGNVLGGNAGSNHIQGLGGSDTLEGYLGNDFMRGGVGVDTFRFAKNYDVDTVRDFDDGTDRLAIKGVNSQSDFNALNIVQDHDQLIISLGNGDRLILDNMVKSDLTWNSDFVTY